MKIVFCHFLKKFIRFFKIPCNTTTLACISSNAAASQIIGLVSSGYCEAGIAGGVELLSDVPIRYNRKVDLIFLFKFVKFLFFRPVQLC